MSTIGSVSNAAISEHIANLPHYNTNEFRDLPANAAPEGVLANGDVYGNAYALLTPSDTALIESITGDKSVQGDPLALAIGLDRGLEGIGLPGGLAGDVTVGYLESIEAAEANSTGNGTYGGINVSSAELNAAIDALSAGDDKEGAAASVSVSA